MAVIFIMAFAVCCYAGNSLSDAASNDDVTGGAIDGDGYKNPNSLIRSRLLLEQAGQQGHFSCTSNSKRDLIKDFGSLLAAVSDSALLTSLSLCKKTSTGREKRSDAARGASATGAKAAAADWLPQLQTPLRATLRLIISPHSRAFLQMKKGSVYISKRPTWDAEACSVIACGVPAGALNAFLAVEPRKPITSVELLSVFK
nr:hypothetical protein Iba_chr10bCG2820 [Ipomoea batatas]GMD46437.1 hypothetical protein Iba_chr10eCG3270 [Ipomoea batatas]GMD47969.1 hypothetical protein Iba_chr10fCG1920 [Ipomoea batatas]